MANYHPEKVAHLGVELQELAKRRTQGVARPTVLRVPHPSRVCLGRVVPRSSLSMAFPFARACTRSVPIRFPPRLPLQLCRSRARR
jgi:hypothetical protein